MEVTETANGVTFTGLDAQLAFMAIKARYGNNEPKDPLQVSQEQLESYFP
jgi:hypothetical protein